MKRVIFATLCILMLTALLASCKQDTPDVVKESDLTPYGAYENTLHVTIAKHNSPNPNMPDGMTITNNPYFDILKEKLNIDLEILWLADNYDMQLALSIMTGDIPDLCLVKDHLLLKQLVDNDLIQPLDGLYEKCAGTPMLISYPSFPDDLWKPSMFDGRQMALPSTVGGLQHALLWVRKDWLDALNLEPPKTLDEIIYVAQQFMQRDPGGNGPGNTVGITTYGNWAFQGYNNAFGLEPICYNYGAYPGAWMPDGSGGARYGSVQPEMKEALIKIKSMYDTGVLDIESFEQGWEQVWSTAHEGRSGLWFFPWNYPFGSMAFYENNPDAELICYPAPLDAQGGYTYVSGALVDTWYTVRKGFQNPEALYKILNVLFDVQQGRDEEGYERIKPIVDRGTDWTIAIPTGSFIMTTFDTIPVFSQRVIDYINNGTTEFINEAGEPARLEGNALYMAQQARDFSTGANRTPTTWVSYVSRVLAGPQTRTPADNPLQAAYHYRTDSMVEMWDRLLLLERDMYRQILTGEQPIDYFDEFVTQWYESGGRVINEEINSTLR